MEQNTPTVKTVKVQLLNLDDRQFAIFRMAFKMHNTVNYQLIAEGDGSDPELVLVDGDGTNAEGHWQNAKQRYPQARVVYFATQPPSFTAPYLGKPIKFDTLFTHLRNLLQGNGVWVPGMGETQSAAQQPAGVSDSWTQARTSTGAVAGERGNAPKHESVAIQRFSTEGTLLGVVQQLAEQNQDMALAVDGKPVLIVFPSIQKVLLAADPERIEALCRQTNLRYETKPVAGSEQLYEKAKLKTQAFIWQLAIWTADGRLIEPVTPDSILKLKAWPNMTRMAYLPESMRLSAFLIKTPVSLSMLYKLLSLDMKDILNFIAATYATGYLQVEQVATPTVAASSEAVVSRPTVSDHTPAEAATESDGAKPRGVLQRLMSRLLGK